MLSSKWTCRTLEGNIQEISHYKNRNENNGHDVNTSQVKLFKKSIFVCCWCTRLGECDGLFVGLRFWSKAVTEKPMFKLHKLTVIYKQNLFHIKITNRTHADVNWIKPIDKNRGILSKIVHIILRFFQPFDIIGNVHLSMGARESFWRDLSVCLGCALEMQSQQCLFWT